MEDAMIFNLQSFQRSGSIISKQARGRGIARHPCTAGKEESPDEERVSEELFAAAIRSSRIGGRIKPRRVATGRVRGRRLD
jgi:hypothetical protein